ncbi:TMV resistance protein N-like protein [Tanacetum coccineum]
MRLSHSLEQIFRSTLRFDQPAQATVVTDKLCKREQPNPEHFLLPNPVQRLLLNDYNHDTDNFLIHFRDQSLLEYLNVANNPFEILPNYTHLEKLMILDLSGCKKLKMLFCLPRQLEELYIFDCDSLERVTFESHKYTLQEFRYKGCVNLFEVEDIFKLVPVSKLKDSDLGNMKWLREYQDREVFLVGDGEVTKGRSLCLQVLMCGIQYTSWISTLAMMDQYFLDVPQVVDDEAIIFFELDDLKKEDRRLCVVFVREGVKLQDGKEEILGIFELCGFGLKKSNLLFLKFLVSYEIPLLV